jgi:hypothetical protein
MNVLLWILQFLLAGIFLRDGYLKYYKPETMKAQGLEDMGLLLFIGFCEMAGAAGLLLPPLIQGLSWFTPLAALGIAIIMILAARFRLKRHEVKDARLTFILMFLSLFVAFGRFFLSPMS